MLWLQDPWVRNFSPCYKKVYWLARMEKEDESAETVACFLTLFNNMVKD